MHENGKLNFCSSQFIEKFRDEPSLAIVQRLTAETAENNLKSKVRLQSIVFSRVPSLFTFPLRDG